MRVRLCVCVCVVDGVTESSLIGAEVPTHPTLWEEGQGGQGTTAQDTFLQNERAYCVGDRADDGQGRLGKYLQGGN